MAVGDSQSIFLDDPPCLRGIDTRIRGDRLHFIVYFRSWDLWAGFPSNLAAIQLLKEYMAAEIGVGDGELIALSKGLHLYEYAWELARTAAGMK
jgi:thymidylate synthase